MRSLSFSSARKANRCRCDALESMNSHKHIKQEPITIGLADRFESLVDELARNNITSEDRRTNLIGAFGKPLLDA